MFRTVNDMLGDIVKVTPSSKMVGDLAIFMVQNDLTPENIVEKGKSLAFPDSVVSYFKGMMGQPPTASPRICRRSCSRARSPSPAVRASCSTRWTGTNSRKRSRSSAPMLRGVT